MSKCKPVFGQVQDHNIVNGTALCKKRVRTMLNNKLENIERDKSFVNDLNIEHSIVSMRVAFVPRSVEIKLMFWRFVTK